MYKVATDIEKCIFDEMRGTNMKYKNRIRSRVSNLGDEKNPDFIAVVLNGSVTAEMIAKMSPEVKSFFPMILYFWSYLNLVK